MFALHRSQSTGGSGPFFVSISSEQKSHLLVMCIDAPESTTYSRTSGLFEAMGVDLPLLQWEYRTLLRSTS